LKPLTTLPPDTPPVDEDLVEQAHPGHGIPSQDPNPAAQFLLEPKEADREAKSVLVGGGVVAGAATGAAIGVVVGGPVGVVVGATLGAVVGAAGAQAASATANPEDSAVADSEPPDLKYSRGSDRPMPPPVDPGR
jgi:non-heme chloroperoxidase